MWVLNIFCILILLTSWTSAQQYNIQSYTVNDGLPTSSIYDLYTDEKGFLWFATPYGVVRFDGENYTTFDEDDGIKDALIYDFHFEADGDIWVTSEGGGIVKFDGKKFSYLPELAALDTMVINYVTSIRKDELWIATNNAGVIIWDQVENTFKYLTEEDQLPDNQVWDIYFQDDNEVWVSTMSGIAVYNRETGISELITVEDGLSGEAIYELVSDPLGRKWVATSNGVSIIQPDKSIDTITEVDGVTLDYVYTIETDNDGNIWIGTERKGIVIVEQNGEMAHITKKEGLTSNFIYRIVKDSQGNIWIASDGNGVSIFKDRSFNFFDVNSPLKSNSVYALEYGRNGELWISTDAGITRFEDGVFSSFSIPESLLTYDEIWIIEQLANGDLLFLTQNFELLQFDGNQFFKPEFYDDLYPYYLNDILVDDDGSIWFSSTDVLLHYKNGELEVYKSEAEDVWKNYLSTLFKDSRGILWIGTEHGVATFENDTFNYFDEKHGINGRSVYEITEDQSGNVWFGTNGGIYYLMEEDILNTNFTFNAFLQNNPSLSETIFLQFDDNGDLWQGTNFGMNYFKFSEENNFSNPLHLQYTLTTSGNGLEFNGDASALDDQGNLWFGSATRGLVRYQSEKSSLAKTYVDPPRIFLRTVFANDNLVYSQTSDTLNSTQLDIAYDQNDLTFNFNTVDYLNIDGISIRYFLEGYDSNWKQEFDLTQIRYTNLPPGTYNLQVAAKSKLSDWTEPQELSSITVLKPFYFTVPFFVIVGLALLGMISAYIKARVNRIEKKELQLLVDKQTGELKEALAEKEVLIKEIHHRVKNNLAVISGLLELQGFRMPAGDAKMAIQESKMRVIAMSKIHENLYQNHDLANVDFRKFIQDLIKSIQQTMDLAEKNIEVISYIDDVQFDVNIGVPLGLIINELLSNAYKHAFIGKKEGSINILFKEKEEVFELCVTDNGVGADPNILNQKSKSLGLTLIKSLCVQIGGYIEYETEEGSQFKLILPKKSLE